MQEPLCRNLRIWPPGEIMLGVRRWNMFWWVFCFNHLEVLGFHICLLIPLRKKKLHWFLLLTTDHQTKWHRHGQEARQTTSSDYENHGLCAVTIPEENRPCYYGPRKALLQALLGGVIEGKKNLCKSRGVHQMCIRTQRISQTSWHLQPTTMYSRV